MSGGAGVFMLVSSHASTFRIVSEFGLGGRAGGWIEEVRKGGRMLMGSGSIAGTGVASAAVPVEGAVRGR